MREKEVLKEGDERNRLSKERRKGCWELGLVEWRTSKRERERKRERVQETNLQTCV